MENKIKIKKRLVVDEIGYSQQNYSAIYEEVIDILLKEHIDILLKQNIESYETVEAALLSVIKLNDEYINVLVKQFHKPTPSKNAAVERMLNISNMAPKVIENSERMDKINNLLSTVIDFLMEDDSVTYEPSAFLYQEGETGHKNIKVIREMEVMLNLLPVDLKQLNEEQVIEYFSYLQRATREDLSKVLPKMSSIQELQNGMKFAIVGSDKTHYSDRWNDEGLMDYLLWQTFTLGEDGIYKAAGQNYISIPANSPVNGFWSIDSNMIDWEKTNGLNLKDGVFPCGVL